MQQIYCLKCDHLNDVESLPRPCNNCDHILREENLRPLTLDDKKRLGLPYSFIEEIQDTQDKKMLAHLEAIIPEGQKTHEDPLPQEG